MYTVMAVRGGGTRLDLPLTACCLSDALCRDPQAGAYLRQRLAREEKICDALRGASHPKPEEYRLHCGYAATLRRALEAKEDE